MARKAREKEAYGTYYITQNSSGCRPLFKNNDDRDYFMNILQRAVNKYDFKLIEYCAHSDNSYHLIIDVNGGDLSNIMKSINISYGMYATCDGKLFNDRYKSQPIKSPEDLAKLQEHLHQGVNDQDSYNSFCQTLILPCNDRPGTFSDCINTVEQATEKLLTIAGNTQQTVQEIISDKTLRNQLIQDFRKNSTLSLKSLGQVFGGLSESSICKILNQ